MVPALFLAHGSPMVALEHTAYTRFLEEYGRGLKPKAIVVFSAHWESEVPAISYTDGIYQMIYDFGGFPPELYAIKYPARGSQEVAALVEERMRKNGISAIRDPIRGLDHGSWTLLYRMYPEADIPVVQISVHPFLSAKEQMAIGQALQGLGKEDILVIGSGATVHNLRLLRWEDQFGKAEPWAMEFDDWLIGKIKERDEESLYRYEQLAPHARLAVPRPEHLVPLFIAFGSGNPQQQGEVIHRSYEFGTLSYLCMQFPA